MNTYNTFSLLFFIRKERSNSDGEAPIFLRITINGKRSEIAIKRFINPEKWDKKANKPKGNNTEAKSLIAYLDTVKNKLYDHHREMIDRNEFITALNLKNRYLGISGKNWTLCECFKKHNEEMQKLIGKEYAKSTHQKYSKTLDHVEKYIQKEYKRDDLFLKELKLEFINGFMHYLMVEKKCCYNTAAKYSKNVMKITNQAVNDEWLDKDPFSNFVIRFKTVNRNFLTEAEVKSIENIKFKIERLNTFRDLFVFACYTGLAYSDIDKLTYDDCSEVFEGEEWLKTERTKTKNESLVPLSEKPLALIEKYKTHPKVQDTKRVFPSFSNQKHNSYLKEIADLCGIQKNLTFHMARHTFATTMTLTKGVSMESVMAMLGHKNIRTTQIYSKVVPQKVRDEMKKVKDNEKNNEVKENSN